MKNAVIGFICLVILVFTGVAIQTSDSRSVRKNELDNSLSTAMEQSMEILTVDPTYAINQENPDEFIADFIEGMLLSTTSNANFEILIHSVDVKKGLLDVEVIEHYKQVIGEGSVRARECVILEDYENNENVYYTVTFFNGDKQVKQVNIHGGDTLSAVALPQNVKVEDGKKIKGWKLTDPTGSTTIYNQENIQLVHVTQDLKFTLIYE